MTRLETRGALTPMGSMRIRGLCVLLVIAAALIATVASAADKPSLKDAMASLKIPPAWYATTDVKYNTNRPWKDARIEIRHLLSKGGEDARRGMKLTYQYKQKNDIGDGSEYPMYLFLGGEQAWAVVEYHKFLSGLIKQGKANGRTHAFVCFASCYAHFGEYEKALQVLKAAMGRVGEGQWRIAQLADLNNAFGDVYGQVGDIAKARQHYEKAAELYPMSKQPYGREKLKPKAEAILRKIAILDLPGKLSGLADGTYSAKTMGYSSDLSVTVTVTGGRITDIKVNGEESIEQAASAIIPKRIVAKQSLKVDCITGATVTCQAVIDGAYQALRDGGLK